MLRCSLRLGGGLLLLFALEVEHDVDEELSEARPVKRLRLEVEADLHV